MNDFTISAVFLIAIILFVVSMINFFSARKANVSKDVENTVKINMKLDEICRTTNETRSDIKSMKNDIRDIQEENIKLKMQVDALRKDVDALKNVK